MYFLRFFFVFFKIFLRFFIFYIKTPIWGSIGIDIFRFLIYPLMKMSNLRFLNFRKKNLKKNFWTKFASFHFQKSCLSLSFFLCQKNTRFYTLFLNGRKKWKRRVRRFHSKKRKTYGKSENAVCVFLKTHKKNTLFTNLTQDSHFSTRSKNTQNVYFLHVCTKLQILHTQFTFSNSTFAFYVYMSKPILHSEFTFLHSKKIHVFLHTQVF